MGELGRAVLIGRLGDVVELMLNQGAELRFGAFGAIVGSQGDQVVGNFAKPIAHLLFLASLLPTTSAEHDLLSLTKHHSALLSESRGRPQQAYIGVNQMGVLWVVDAACLRQDLAT
ncbi:hypothetical protein D3C77_480530 [compost metagenome]